MYIVHFTILLVYGHHLIVMQYVRNYCITFSYQLFSLLENKRNTNYCRRLSFNDIHSHCPAVIIILISPSLISGRKMDLRSDKYIDGNGLKDGKCVHNNYLCCYNSVCERKLLYIIIYIIIVLYIYIYIYIVVCRHKSRLYFIIIIISECVYSFISQFA